MNKSVCAWNKNAHNSFYHFPLPMLLGCVNFRTWSKSRHPDFQTTFPCFLDSAVIKLCVDHQNVPNKKDYLLKLNPILKCYILDAICLFLDRIMIIHIRLACRLNRRSQTENENGSHPYFLLTKLPSYNHLSDYRLGSRHTKSWKHPKYQTTFGPIYRKKMQGSKLICNLI